MKKIIISIVVLSISFTTFSQDSDSSWNINQIVYNLRKEANILNFRNNGNKKKLFATEFAAKIFKLKSLLDESYHKFLKVSDSDSLYRKSLLSGYHILKNKSNIDQSTVQDLIDDLNAKLNSYSLGLEENETDDIPIEVTTYDSAFKEAPGYYVYWNFWLDKDNPNANSKFSSFTNPTSKDFLPPGVYDIWVGKEGSSKRYPPLNSRTKMIIFLKNGEKAIPLKIFIK